MRAKEPSNSYDEDVVRPDLFYHFNILFPENSLKETCDCMLKFSECAIQILKGMIILNLSINTIKEARYKYLKSLGL